MAPAARLHADVRGAGPAVLFLHGLPTSGRLFGPLAARLAARHTCVVVDLPGLGRSPALAGGRLDPDAIVAALEAERAARGIDAWAIVGHDAGSALAVHYAAAHPGRVTALALLAPPLFPDLEPPPLMRLLRAPVIGPLAAPAVAAVLRRALPRLLRRPDEAGRAAAAAFGQPFRGLRASQRLVRLARWGDPAVVLARTAALLPALCVPTLVVHATRDRFVGAAHAARAAAAIPGARLRRVDAGHLAPLDAPAALAKLLSAFLGAAPATARRAGCPAAAGRRVRRRQRASAVSAATRDRTRAASASGLSPHHRSAAS